MLPAAGASQFIGPRVIVTEKLDGANCCIQHGAVYARTHGHEATHASFGPSTIWVWPVVVTCALLRSRALTTLSSCDAVKLLAQRFSAMAYDMSFDLDSVALFGENMFGVHSIEYVQGPTACMTPHAPHAPPPAPPPLTTFVTPCRYDNLSSFFYMFGVRRHVDGA